MSFIALRHSPDAADELGLQPEYRGRSKRMSLENDRSTPDVGLRINSEIAEASGGVDSLVGDEIFLDDNFSLVAEREKGI